MAFLLVYAVRLRHVFFVFFSVCPSSLPPGAHSRNRKRQRPKRNSVTPSVRIYHTYTVYVGKYFMAAVSSMYVCGWRFFPSRLMVGTEWDAPRSPDSLVFPFGSVRRICLAEPVIPSSVRHERGCLFAKEGEDCVCRSSLLAPSPSAWAPETCSHLVQGEGRLLSFRRKKKEKPRDTGRHQRVSTETHRTCTCVRTRPCGDASDVSVRERKRGKRKREDREKETGAGKKKVCVCLVCLLCLMSR